MARRTSVAEMADAVVDDDAWLEQSGHHWLSDRRRGGPRVSQSLLLLLLLAVDMCDVRWKSSSSRGAVRRPSQR